MQSSIFKVKAQEFSIGDKSPCRGRLVCCLLSHKRMSQINNMGESRSRSVPHAVSMGDTTLYTCTSSSFSSSPLWPQSFGRSMDIYSRSNSRRSRQEREPDLETSGVEPTLSEQLASASIKTEYDIEVPLLRNLRSAVSGNGEQSADIRAHGLENIRSTTYGHKSDKNGGLESEQNGNHSQDMHPHGSSFLQALFNGMNVLAGENLPCTNVSCYELPYLFLLPCF